MSKEQYLEMRKSGQYDFSWFYSYYLQNKSEERDTIAFETFVQSFRAYFQFQSRDILNYLDGKFELQKIEDINGNILYIN